MIDWRRLALALVICAAALLAAASAPAERSRDLHEPGRTYTTWFLTSQTAPLWERLPSWVRLIVGSEESFAASTRQILQGEGTETAVLEERIFFLHPLTIYGRRSIFSRDSVPRLIQWTYDSSGEIWALSFQPERAARAPFAGYQTRTPLRLPFTGEWVVTAGGSNLLENHHVVVADQRFAYDIVGWGESGVFSGNGARNEDYAGFGRPILAPADGIVVEAVDGAPDNLPGQTETGHIAGNRIVIDHGNGEFSMLAHFRQGTIRVRVADRVTAGQQLGECGNSGNSTGPHLHYHLQNTPFWGGGEGLPAPFRDYVEDGIPVDRGEPTRGQIVAPQDASGLAQPPRKRLTAREQTLPRLVSRP